MNSALANYPFCSQSSHPEEAEGRLEGRTQVAAWTYILRCCDGSYYVGCTTNLDRRIGQHRSGSLGGYTSTRLPIEVVWVAEYYDVRDAIDLERQLKGWSRAKKEAVIRGDWDRLPELSRRGFRPTVIDPACFETRPEGRSSA